MRIVVVEQDYLQRKHLHAVCNKISGVARVDNFGSIKTAAAFLIEGCAELVIIDLDWKPLDGILLARQIRSRSKNTAMVFLATEKQHCYDAMQLDAEGYLLKPYLDMELTVLIEKVLQRSRTDVK